MKGEKRVKVTKRGQGRSFIKLHGQCMGGGVISPVQVKVGWVPKFKKRGGGGEGHPVPSCESK